MLDALREEVHEANMALVKSGLAVLTWGNASGIDRDRGLVVIKPSGVDYDAMTPRDMVIVDMDGKVAEGDLRPSSDTPTHLVLYREWADVGGIVHTHSHFATAYAQAGRDIPCYGTTHADYCPGAVPCIRELTAAEVREAYEANTGVSIVEHYRNRDLRPLEYPGAVLFHHGPFTWGKTPAKAVESAIILENVAHMAMLTAGINPAVSAIPEYITEKHYLRKHGPGAYYGQG